MTDDERTSDGDKREMDEVGEGVFPFREPEIEDTALDVNDIWIGDDPAVRKAVIQLSVNDLPVGIFNSLVQLLEVVSAVNDEVSGMYRELRTLRREVMEMRKDENDRDG